MKHLSIIFISFLILLIFIFIATTLISFMRFQSVKKYTWTFQSIDTMKYSRDLSREKLKDPTFDKVIETQIASIAATGATYVAIATPYDEEFYPILKRWVDEARRQKLKVWFRGNFSGWEGWFNYPKINQKEHEKMVQDFIFNHSDIFQDGDIFTPCPECENGGPGDPRTTRDIKGYRDFLVSEHVIAASAFAKIGKQVTSSYNSMNADVARLIMNSETTKKLGGIVVIDHYVAAPETLQKDIKEIAKKSQGKVVLGEFGAPIPDLQGDMSEQEQYEWVQKTLELLKSTPELVGVNYWVSHGGTTKLWNDDNTPRFAVQALTRAYKNFPIQ